MYASSLCIPKQVVTKSRFSPCVCSRCPSTQTSSKSSYYRAIQTSIPASVSSLVHSRCRSWLRPSCLSPFSSCFVPSFPFFSFAQFQCATAKAILTQLEFDATGKSKKISVDANKNYWKGPQVFKVNRNNKWISLVGVALTRDHPDCLDDLASYQPQAENLRNSSNNADLWIPCHTCKSDSIPRAELRLKKHHPTFPGEKITHYNIVVDQLDSHGLIPVTLTGLTVRYYERNAGEPSRTVTRAVGEKDGAGNELTGPRYDMLARIAAILCIALAFERAVGLQLGLGVFFQKPPAIPLTIIDVDAEDDEGPMSSVSQESFDLGM